MSALDLADIQGGILRVYGFPKARYFFLTIRNPDKGRAFVETLRPRITTAARWKDPDREEPLLRTRNPRVKDVVRAEGVSDYPGEIQLIKPKVTINIAFTFAGLLALEVPTRTLREMPDEFIDGMAKRAPILGDDPFLAKRDAVWRNSEGENRVHVMVSLNAGMNPDGTPVAELEEETRWLEALCAASEGGVVLLDGTGPDGALYQEMSAVLREYDGQMWAEQQGAFRPVRRLRRPGVRRAAFRRGRAAAHHRRRQDPARSELGAAGDGRVPARLFGRGAGDSRRRDADRVQPQRHLHGLSQAA